MYKTNLQLTRCKAGGIHWEIGIEVYTPISKIGSNENLLYNTGNSIQDSIMTYMVIESKTNGEIFMSVSLCCTAESNTTL